MTSEIVSVVIGDIRDYIINKISYNKKIKDYRKAFMSPYKIELLKLPTYLEKATYIVDYRGEISMDKNGKGNSDYSDFNKYYEFLINKINVVIQLIDRES